jgi:hypothetical protein
MFLFIRRDRARANAQLAPIWTHCRAAAYAKTDRGSADQADSAASRARPWLIILLSDRHERERTAIAERSGAKYGRGPSVLFFERRIEKDRARVEKFCGTLAIACV